MQYHSPAALFFSSSSSTNAYFLSFYQLQTLCRLVFLTDSFVQKSNSLGEIFYLFVS